MIFGYDTKSTSNKIKNQQVWLHQTKKLYTKINSKFIKDLNASRKTPRRNHGKFLDIGLGNDLLAMK